MLLFNGNPFIWTLLYCTMCSVKFNDLKWNTHIKQCCKKSKCNSRFPETKPLKLSSEMQQDYIYITSKISDGLWEHRLGFILKIWYKKTWQNTKSSQDNHQELQRQRKVHLQKCCKNLNMFLTLQERHHNKINNWQGDWGVSASFTISIICGIL